MDEQLELWLEQFTSPNTRRVYRRHIEQFIAWAQLDNINSITVTITRRYIEHLRATGNADTTINQKLAALHSWFEYWLTGQDDGFYTDRANPFDARRVKRPKLNREPRAKFPSIDQMKAILRAIDRKTIIGKRDYALIRLYLVTSRRSAEILNLRWRDLRPIGGGEYAFRYKNKGGQYREAVLSRHLYDDIVVYLRAAGRFPLADEDYIFTAIRPQLAERLPHIKHAPIGAPLTNSFVNQMLKKYARRAGVNEQLAHVHALRHVGARMRVIQMRQNGSVDYDQIRQLLGHTSLRTTQIYIETAIGDPTDPGIYDAVRAWQI